MGITLKVIMSSAEPLQLTANSNIGFQGLAGFSNEDPNVAVSCLHLPNQTPASVEAVWCGGARIEKNSINQVQDLGAGNIPAEYWFAAIPFGPMPGDTCQKGAYVANPQNTACTFVAASFTLPAVNSTVQVTVLSTSEFAEGDFIDHATNDGVFCGGRFWDIVSIDSGTTMTLRLRDVFGAVVTMLG